MAKILSIPFSRNFHTKQSRVLIRRTIGVADKARRLHKDLVPTLVRAKTREAPFIQGSSRCLYPWNCPAWSVISVGDCLTAKGAEDVVKKPLAFEISSGDDTLFIADN